MAVQIISEKKILSIEINWVMERIFFEILSVCQKYFFYGISKLEYRVAGFLGVLFWLNMVSIFYIFRYPVLESWSRAAIIFSILGIMLVSMAYFVRPSKLKSIKSKFEFEPKHNHGQIISFFYILLSIILFIFVI